LKASLAKYNKLLAPARQRFEASAGLNVIRSTGDPRSLELFLLYFCAIGAQMTEPVEGWIRRAGDRCAALGFSELAEGLRKHARAESGHYLMMVAEVVALALANHAGFSNGLVLSSVGTRDGQDLILSRFGLTAVPGIEPVNCDYYDDTVQVTYCAGTQRMQPRFLRAMRAMASVMGLEQVLGAATSFLGSREEHVGDKVKL
jgi:hypothetical protein